MQENEKVIIRDVHDEEYAILDPDGVEIYRGCNALVLTDARIQIKEKQLKGYCVEFHGEKIRISSVNGELENWPDGLCDAMTNLLVKLF